MKGKPAPEPTTELAKPYQPTPRELAAVDAFYTRREAAHPSPSLKITEQRGKLVQVRPDHPDLQLAHKLLMRALGTTDLDFYGGLMSQLANASAPGEKLDHDRLNFMLAATKGIEPRDEIEAMIAAQMAAVHMLTMTFARRLATVENLAQQDSAERAFNKLARTFAVQMDTLKRYRTGGEQRVTVQHVTVNDGGQAIVAAVVPQGVGGGAGEKQPPTP